VLNNVYPNRETEGVKNGNNTDGTRPGSKAE
jgi:hypothetical protein